MRPLTTAGVACVAGIVAVATNCHALTALYASGMQRLTDRSLKHLAAGCPGAKEGAVARVWQ